MKAFVQILILSAFFVLAEESGSAWHITIKPNTYSLLMESKDGQNWAVQMYRQTIGFWVVEVREQVIGMNGIPVK